MAEQASASAPQAASLQGLPGLLAPVQPQIEAVEKVLFDQVKTFVPEVQPLVRQTLEAGGKRLRPALAILAGEAAGGSDDRHVLLGVIIELIHTATLVHDDILDGADLRRMLPTAKKVWGNEVSVLLGDALFAHALTLTASFSTTLVCQEVSQATNQVCSGEILQTFRRGDFSLTQTEYLRYLEMKTAALFEVSCRVAARFHEPDEEGPLGQALGEYGRNLGIAYQLYDDFLDLFGEESEAGKSLGTDVETGKLTLPVILALEKSGPDLQRAIHSLLLGNPQGDPRKLRQLLLQTRAFEDGMQVLGRFLENAAKALGSVPDSAARTILLGFPRFIETRTRLLRKAPC